MIYHNSIDATAIVNKRLIAYINTHKTITVEQQKHLTDIQLLSIVELMRKQQAEA